jgi:hypothetical protein
MAARWQSRLSRIIELGDGTQLNTLADARSYILESLSSSDQARNSWQIAMAKLIAAADHNGSIRAATDAFSQALFFQGKLNVGFGRAGRSRTR